MTVGRLLEEMSSLELTEWAAEYSLRADEMKKAQKRAEARRR